MSPSAYIRTVHLIILLLGLQSVSIGQIESNAASMIQFIEEQLEIGQSSQISALIDQDSLTIAKELTHEDDSLFNAKFYNLLGRLNAEKENFQVAIEYMTVAESYLNANNESPLFIQNYIDRGRVYFSENELLKSKSDYNKAFKLAQKINDKVALSTVYIQLGLMEIENRRLNIALENFMSSLVIRQQIGDQKLIAHGYQYIGYCHYQSKSYKQAIEYYQKAIKAIKSIDNLDTEDWAIELSAATNNLAMCYLQTKRGNQARELALKSIQIAKPVKDQKTRATLKYNSARILYLANYYQDALNYGLEIQNTALDLADEQLQLNALEILTYSQEKLNNYDKAIDYARKIQKLKERLRQEKQEQRLANERFSYQALSNKKMMIMIEKENALKTTELESQERVTQLLILLVFISLLGIIGLFYSNNQKNKVNEQLRQTNELIESQNMEIRKQQNALKTAKSELEDKVIEMERLTEEKSHLLSIVAHDLRTPLNSILGLCELIEIESEDKEPDPTTEQYLSLIQESGNRMLSMINTLLNVRKIEAQNIEVNFEFVRVESVITKINADFDNWMKRKSITVSLQGIQENDQVYVDENLFRQVIENLISNAIKYSPINSKMQIIGSSENDKYTITVRDFGPGISRSDQSKMFQKYQRLSAQPTAGEDSMGIGLSLVKKLVDLMHGSISVKSELGQGSSFIVKFSSTKIQ